MLGTAAVVAAFALVAGLSWAAGHDKIDVSGLGDRDFEVGKADRLARRIASDGPFLFADASPNHERDIWLQHLGTSEKEGWIAVLAGTRRCPVQWSGDHFEDCAGSRYPPDGAGLTRYATRVDGNTVYVELRTTVP